MRAPVTRRVGRRWGRARTRALRASLLGGAIALAGACGDGSIQHDAGVSSGSADGSAQGGSADAAGVRTDAMIGTAAGREAGAGGDGARVSTTPDQCNQVNIMFTANAPTVYILVDRSSSMFDRGFWDPLKMGVLSVVQDLGDEVRFGFTTYTGQNGGVCPDLTPAGAIGENNYAAIEAAYDGLKAPTYKGETPTALALAQVADQLAADPGMGSKYILLVTDGEPDFCDDTPPTCPRDAVIGAVQAAYARGVSTFIFSLGGDVDQSHLQDVANAGTGQPVEDHQNAVKQQCSTVRGSYAATQGSAPYFQPNVDTQTLVNALSAVIAGVRSCVFELQGRLEIDLSAAAQGVVEIDGVRVPYGAPDGYRMNSSTQLELLGASCERLRDPASQRVFIDFPCEAIIAF